MGGAVNSSFVLGSAQFALSTFLVPMERELDWSRSIFFGALSTRFLIAGILSPVIGPLADRVRAPRLMLPAGVLVLGGSISAVKWIDDPVLFFAVYGIAGGAGTAVLQLTTWEALVLKWFSRKRTRALVVASIGEASGPMVFPMLITAFIALFGWRDAWLWYGVLATVVLMPFALAVRTRPEQVGQRLDGGDAPVRAEARAPRASALAEASFTRSEALHTHSFWILAAVFTVTGVAITGYQAQWIPHFRDVGFSASVAAGAVAVYGASNIASRVIWGAMTVRFEIRTLLGAHATAAAAGVAMLLFFVDSTPMLFVWAVYQGLVLGSFFPLHTLIMAEYFGRSHIGAIRGSMLPISSVARGGGALSLGALRDWRGSYDLAFAVVLVAWATIGSLLVISRRPRQRRESDERVS